MGQRWLASPCPGNTPPIGVGVPPDAETRCSPLVKLPLGVKRITPSLFHVPPRPEGASHSVCTGPPAMSSLFSFPPAKKPKDFPSGDQNGKIAPSVSVRTLASSEPTS